MIKKRHHNEELTVEKNVMVVAISNLGIDDKVEKSYHQ